MPRGRRTKLTPQVQRAICAALKKGATRRAAYGLVGISHGTFYRWMNTGEQAESGIHREFRDAVVEAEARGESSLSTVLYDIAHNEEAKECDRVRAALAILARRYGWHERTEITGVDGGSVEVSTRIVTDLPSVEAGRSRIRDLAQQVQAHR